MRFLAGYRDRRRTDQERQVRRAITMLRPECATAYPISRLAYVSSGQVFVVLWRLEVRGEVTRHAVDAPDNPVGRRWVYELTDSAVVR
jgi:hypothetical protein